MTKTEAAEIIAIDVRVWARRNGTPITKDLVEARLSEARHMGGLYPAANAARPSWRTILRVATRDEL